MSWEKEVEEIERRKKLASKMGGEERVARHHQAGKLTVRQRIERLLDTDSFRETGALAGKATYDEEKLVDFIPSNFVMGRGSINGRPVIVGGDDFTVRGVPTTGP